MVDINVSPWLLDRTTGKIKKEIIFYRDGAIHRRIQVVYAVQDLSGSMFDMSQVLPDLPRSLSKSQHLSILLSPCLGLGDGFMVAQLGNVDETDDDIKVVEPIISTIEISDQPSKDFTLIHFTERMDVIKVANLIGKGDDVVFELYGNPDKTLYLRFPIANEPGFGQLREVLLK